MTTEVRDNREGQKNSPKGQGEQKGANGGGNKNGALEHGHGKNSATPVDGAREDSRGSSGDKG